MLSEPERALKERLDAYYDWPCAFLFKFIVPQERGSELLALFGAEAQVRTRESSGGRYLAVTAEVDMTGSDAVLAVYRQAGEIEGVVAL
jgi:uncharacterized protein